MSPPKKETDADAKLGKYRRLDQDPPDQDGGNLAEEETSMRADTVKVLEAITACQVAVTTCQTNLTTKIEEVKADICLVKQDFQKLRERVTEAEACLSSMEDSLPLFRIPQTPCSCK